MNISQLEVGSTYKNYKELCQVLEEPLKGGNAKKSQVKDWERYFKYDKQGNKFIITHIYNIPLPNNGNPIQYVETVKKIIVYKILNHTGTGKCIINKNKLLSEMKEMNDKYINDKYQQLQQSEQHKTVSLSDIASIYSFSHDTLTELMEKGFKKLESMRLISYNHLFNKEDWLKTYENYIITISLNDPMRNEPSFTFLDRANEYTINSNPNRNKIQGIYCITNLITNKTYVGSSIDIDSRLESHIKNLQGNKHYNYKLQEEYNTYHLENFKFDLLEEVKNTSDLPERECYWINQKGGLENIITYNISNPLEEHEIINKRNTKREGE